MGFLPFALDVPGDFGLPRELHPPGEFGVPAQPAGGGAAGVASAGMQIPTLTADVARAAPASDAPVAAVVDAVAALGVELVRAAGNAHGNAVVSPLSAAYAFAMARAGAGGQTAAEIDRALRFPADGLHPAVDALTRRLVTAQVPTPADPGPRRPGPARAPVLCVANGLFPQHGLPVGEPFLRTLARHYGTGVHPVDFTGDAEQVVNSWVRRQTAGRIDQLFDRLPAATRLVLANTVYLRADWARPFTRLPTTDAAFTRADGTRGTVPTMRQYAELRYAAAGGWQAVELPYAGTDLAMLVLVPPAGTDPVGALDPAALAGTVSALSPRYVDLALPRFDLAGRLDLVPTMRQLGVLAAFTPAADFAGISAGLHLDQAVQRATITVDERGTEAAAATGLVFLVSAQRRPATVVRADRPFAFAVLDRTTGLPVFAGTVGDPGAR